MRAAFLISFNAALLIGAILVVTSLRQAGNQLRAELGEARLRHARLTALGAERERLRTTLPTTEELASLREDQDALPRLRHELSDLRQRAEQRILDPQSAADEPPRRAAAENPRLTAKDWTNLGRDSAQDALVSTLWALVNQEVDTLADLISLSPEGRAKVQALMADLPSDLRIDQASPERVAALLASRDRAPQAIQILQVTETNNSAADMASIRVRVTTAEGETKRPTLLAFRHAHTGGWRLYLPDPIVDYYLGNVGGRSGREVPP